MASYDLALRIATGPIAMGALTMGLIALAACSAEAPVHCRFEASHTIGASTLGALHLAMVSREVGLVAIWSSREGLHARALDVHGAPTDETTRVGPECEGGIAAASDGEGVVIACSRRARVDKGQDGNVVLIELDTALVARRARPIAQVGRDSLGVDLAARADGSWSVIWHDGTPGAWAVSRARVRWDDDSPVDAQELSSGVLAASPYPRVHVRGGDGGEEALFVFEESWRDGGFARGRVLVARERGSPIAVEELEAHDARAQLVHDGRSWVLVFRDLRRPSPRGSLYARRLGDDLRPIEPVRRVTRADTDGSPRALHCREHLVAVVPRTWDTDVLVGLDLLDARLRKPLPEQQVYEWSARFPFADAVCRDDAVITLVASRAEVGGGDAALHTIGMRCTR